MVSFADLLLKMELHPDERHGSQDTVDDKGGPLLDSGEESEAIAAIRSGMNLRKPKCGDFWEDFITVIGNADAISSLLEVPKEKVTGWASRIRDLMDKVKAADSTDDSSKKSVMAPTGNDAVTNQDNSPQMNMRPEPS